MNYYNFHIGDYAAHTKHLSLLEDLAYRRLIDAYYLAERPFIGSSTDVAREIGMRDQIEAVEYVLSKFFTKTEDGFSHGRCDDEIAHYQDKRSKASNAGKASAERRNNIRSTSAGNNSTSVGNSAADVQPTNNQEPITNISTTDVVDKPAKQKTKSSQRGLQLQTEFEPDQGSIDLAAELNVSLREELPKFSDYHRSKGSVMKDWQAALRNWIRNAAKWAANSGHKSVQYKTQAQERKDTIDFLTGKNQKPQADSLPFIEGEALRVA